MAFPAGPAAAGVTKLVADISPVLGMGVDTQAGNGAVTFQADIALGMTGLAGNEVFPGFPGVAVGPLMPGQY